MNSDDSPLANIVYMSLPEDAGRNLGHFKIDPTVLLPVEVPPGEEDWRVSDLSWEMIVAAMLKILAYDPNHKDAAYFREFTFAVQPDISAEMTKTAIFKAEKKEFSIAEEIFLALSNLEPEEVRHFINLALVNEEKAELYRQLGNLSLAEESDRETFETYRKALSLHDDSPDLHFNVGYFMLKQENPARSGASFRRFLELAPKDPRRSKVSRVLLELAESSNSDSLFHEAFDFIRLGKESEGIEKIRIYLDKNPDVWNAWFLLGWAYRRTGKYESGAEALLKSLELEDKQTDIYNELAICLMELGKYQESRKHLTAAYHMEPENIKIISNMGILSLKEGNIPEAEGFFRTVLELHPEDLIALKYIDYIKQENL